MSTRRSRSREIRHERIRQCSDGTAGVAPTVPQAGRPPLIGLRQYCHGNRRGVHAQGFETTSKRSTVVGHQYGWQWIWVPRRPPHLLRGIARHPYIALHLVVERLQIRILKRPVARTAIQRVHAKIIFMHAWPNRIVMNRGAPITLTRIEIHRNAVRTRLDYAWRGPLEPSRPNLRTIEIG